MSDPVLERTTEATWPEHNAMTAWSFQTEAKRWNRAWTRVDELYAVRVEGRIQAGLALYLPSLTLLGRPLTVGAYAAVAVAPEARGTGLASGMMRASLRDLRARGVHLASLYASTQSLYRGVGFELAGHRIVHRFPIRQLKVRDDGCAVREIDAAEVQRRWRPRHAHLTRTPGLWNRLFEPNEGESRAYAIGDDGYVVLGFEGDNDVIHLRDVQVHTVAQQLRVWSLCRAMATMADTVEWVGGPDDAALAMLPEHGGTKVEAWLRWMVRVLDVPGALRARGWATDGALDLDVEDHLFPENHGPWRLVVRDGAAEMTQGGTGALRLDVRALASLMTGYTTPAALTHWGLASGSDGTLDAAQRLFAAPTPWMPDFY